MHIKQLVILVTLVVVLSPVSSQATVSQQTNNGQLITNSTTSAATLYVQLFANKQFISKGDTAQVTFDVYDSNFTMYAQKQVSFTFGSESFTRVTGAGLTTFTMTMNNTYSQVNLTASIPTHTRTIQLFGLASQPSCHTNCLSATLSVTQLQVFNNFNTSFTVTVQSNAQWFVPTDMLEVQSQDLGVVNTLHLTNVSYYNTNQAYKENFTVSFAVPIVQPGTYGFTFSYYSSYYVPLTVNTSVTIANSAIPYSLTNSSVDRLNIGESPKDFVTYQFSFDVANYNYHYYISNNASIVYSASILSLFDFHLVDFLSNYQIQTMGTDHFTALEDFYSYTLPECYASFFTSDMYLRFGQTGDLTDILNFVRSIMFSKLVLLIDSCSTHSFSTIAKDIAPFLHGSSVVSLPAGACLIDIETVGLDEYSDFILFSLFSNNSFTGYYLNKPDEAGQQEFRAFIDYLLQGYDIIYLLNGSFESLFFPSYTNFVDIKFNKYQYWASSRKLVHLPFYHLQYDPGSGKNVPIWNKLYLLEHDDQWKDLMLHRTVTNILTKIAILSSNELKIPFQDPIVADPRRLRPTPEFLEQFGEYKQTLLKKKVQFHPIVYHDTYGYQEGKYAEMYLDSMLFFEEESDEETG